MTTIDQDAGNFVIDAALLAAGFGLSQDEIRQRMNDGRITSGCEIGVDEDAGRWRLTFHHEDRACRFIVDEAGNVLKRAIFPIKTKPREGTAQRDDTGSTPPGTGANA